MKDAWSADQELKEHNHCEDESNTFQFRQLHEHLLSRVTLFVHVDLNRLELQHQHIEDGLVSDRKQSEGRF